MPDAQISVSSSRKDRDRDRDRDGRRSSKKSSHRRHRSPSTDSDSDSDDSYTSEESPVRKPRRAKTVNVVSTREYASDDDSYRSSRKSRSGRDRHREHQNTRISARADPDAYELEVRRPSRRDRDYGRDRSVSRSPSPAGKKSMVDDILGAFGLVDKDNSSSSRHRSSRSHARDRDYDDDYDDRSSRHGHSSSRDVSRRDQHDVDKQALQAQALKAAITAAAIEAWRTRGDKTNSPAQRLMRIASAAIAAGGLDALVDRNPDKNGMRHIAEAVVGGLVTSKSMGGNLERKDGMKNRLMDGLIGKTTGMGVSTMQSKGSGSKGSSSRRSRSETSPRGLRGRLKDMM